MTRHFPAITNVIIFAVCPRRWQLIFNGVRVPLCETGCVCVYAQLCDEKKRKRKEIAHGKNTRLFALRTKECVRGRPRIQKFPLCVSVFFYAICHLVQRQRLGIESLKSRNHLYVKAHLSSGEKSLQWMCTVADGVWGETKVEAVAKRGCGQQKENTKAVLLVCLFFSSLESR